MRFPQCSTRFAVILPLLLAGAAAVADDWPQLFGPNHDGVSQETLNPAWPAEGFKPAWKVPLTGWSSFVVSGNRAFTLTSRPDKPADTPKEGDKPADAPKDEPKKAVAMRELCIAIDATGTELWAADITKTAYTGAGTGPPRGGTMGGSEGGPQSTPAVNDGRVYVHSLDQKLCCLDAQTGKELWRVDVKKDHGGGYGRAPRYGIGESPTVDGDLVFISGGGPGQSLMALNKISGQVVWKTEDLVPSYSTPVVTTIHGERQIVFYLHDFVVGISVKDGKALWRSPIAGKSSNNAIPVVSQDRVFVSSCDAGPAKFGGGLFAIDKDGDGFHANEVYKALPQNSSYMTSPVLREGHLYGEFGQFGKEGVFKCIEFATGTVKWEKKGLGWGSCGIVVGNKLAILSDFGEIVLVDPTPEAYKELARFKAIEGKCWSTPAFSNGRIYVRSNKEGACFDLSTKNSGKE
jgi:outer membrane protein assembly factor BamB